LVQLSGHLQSSAVFGKSIFSNSAGVALGLILTNYTNTVTFSLKSIEISRDLYKIYSRIIQLDNYIKDYTVVLLNLQIVITQLSITLLKHNQNAMYQFEHMDEAGINAINKLTKVIVKFGLFLFPYVITEFISNIIKSFYSTKLYIEIDDVLRNILFTNETALKLSFDKNSKVLIDNLRADSKAISRDGSNLIIDSIEQSINGAYGIGVLTANASSGLEVL
jgi:hypothetical protein